MSSRRKIALRASGGSRLDHALLHALREQGIEVSRGRLKEIFRAGQVLIQGHPRRASWILPSQPLQAELAIDLGSLGGTARPSVRGSFLPILYEDEELLALHKPSGVPSLPHSAAETETAVGSALGRFPGLAEIGRDPLSPGLLHRLDTGTSGILIFAKTPAEYERLRRAWKERRVRKIYRARISSPGQHELPRIPLSLRLRLAHDAGSDRRMLVLPEKGYRKFRGKPLETATHLKRVAPTGAQDIFDVEVEIETGVMHQIRCTLSWLGWPVLGDPIYRGAPSERLWLHAWRLSLPLGSGTQLALEAQLPKGWAEA